MADNYKDTDPAQYELYYSILHAKLTGVILKWSWILLSVTYIAQYYQQYQYHTISHNITNITNITQCILYIAQYYWYYHYCKLSWLLLDITQYYQYYSVLPILHNIINITKYCEYYSILLQVTQNYSTFLTLKTVFLQYMLIFFN